MKNTTETVKTAWRFRKLIVGVALTGAIGYGLVGTTEGHMLAWYVFNHTSVQRAYAQWQVNQDNYLAAPKAPSR